jgi:XapX domain-containing protein
LVGVFYSSIGVQSPAPPVVALTGLLGMVLAEKCWPKLLLLAKALA